MKYIIVTLLFIFNAIVGCGNKDLKNDRGSLEMIKEKDFEEESFVDVKPIGLEKDTIIEISGKKYKLSYSLSKNGLDIESTVSLFSFKGELMFKKVLSAESFIEYVDTSKFKDIVIQDLTYVGLASDGSSKFAVSFNIGPRGAEHDYIELVGRIDLNGNVEISDFGFE